MSDPVPVSRTAKATEASLESRAGRAIDDPVRRSWAARMIRIGLARNLVALSDLGISQNGDGDAT